MKPSQRIHALAAKHGRIEEFGEGLVSTYATTELLAGLLDYLDERDAEQAQRLHDERVVCETCRVDGSKSTVRIVGGTTTAVGVVRFYDEEGRFHDHDSNVTRLTYRCSRGHSWDDARKPSCWCAGRVSFRKSGGAGQ